MIQPVRSGDAFLQALAALPREASAFHLFWLGQSGFLLDWGGERLLLDPYLSDSLTRKYAATDKPHVRMTAIPVDPGALEGITLATSSHAHTDHFDAETLLPLMRRNPGMRLVIPEANRSLAAARLGCDPALLLGLDPPGSVTVPPFTVHAVPAAHETLERDEAGRHRFLGYVVQWGEWTLYHSGDTLWYPGLEDWLKPWKVDLALLPINGRAPERRVAGNLNGGEAARLAKAMGARLAIPCHYEMFTFNTASPGPFVEAARAIHQPVRVLKCAEHFTSEELP